MRNSGMACEDVLAKLFTDPEFRARFRADPDGVGREAGLDEASRAALANTDWVGLELAARSYHHKRYSRARLRKNV